ncbi:hypothetical protein SDC9_100179 [bioreactor metagenome]|uniref:Uncharacterized protein n=1 Tax=bioreactor metagenome TaxID=1076179 RepID=A0A645AM57_9ZZZZ
MKTIFSFICSLTFSDKKFGFSEANNLRFSNHNELVLLLLLPFFEIKTSWYYANSALYGFLACGKDIFYRLINDCMINWRNLAIIALLHRKEMTKRSKKLGYYYVGTIVNLKGVPVKLHFCKASKRGNWNNMMTINTLLAFEEAYKIYSTRWSGEVFFYGKSKQKYF